MEDFDVLASSLAVGLGDVRGCLILSRDGLVLGSSPADAEATLSPARIRFAALGDIERGFAQVGSESWCYVRRGPYAAFAIAGRGARPGLVLDQMDRALLVAEEGRARYEGFGAREGEPAPPPTTRSRPLLHPDHNHATEPVEIDVPRTPAAPEASEDLPPVSDRDLGLRPPTRIFDAGVVGRVGDRVAAPENEPAAQSTVPGSQAGPRMPEADERDAVDRFSLAREFGQLLQRDEDLADG